MDRQLLFICSLTFVIHIIGTLAYSVRIAGIRTRRIAVSLALFSILVLVSRTSNSFLGPFLAKRVESTIAMPLSGAHLLGDFRWLLASASLATIVGAVLIPTFQRVFSRAVLHFQVHRSVPKLILHGFFKGGLSYVKDNVSVPRTGNLTGLRDTQSISLSVTVLNVLATALWTVGGVRCVVCWGSRPISASHIQHVVLDYQRRRHGHDGDFHRSAYVRHD